MDFLSLVYLPKQLKDATKKQFTWWHCIETYNPTQDQKKKKKSQIIKEFKLTTIKYV